MNTKDLSVVRRFRVEWRHKHPIWGEVFASTKEEAVRVAKQGKFIKGTVDSDPGKDDWSKAEAVESPNVKAQEPRE